MFGCQQNLIKNLESLPFLYCLENGIGRIIFGWNKKQKDGINIGSKNNQKFVQVPTAKLKERIQQLCELYGIEFVETEESYTS